MRQGRDYGVGRIRLHFGSSRVTRYKTELKCCQICVTGLFRTTHFPWLNGEMWQHCTAQKRSVSYHCKATNEGCPQPVIVIGGCISSERQTS